jgi:hypothetical protein
MKKPQSPKPLKKLTIADLKKVSAGLAMEQPVVTFPKGKYELCNSSGCYGKSEI